MIKQAWNECPHGHTPILLGDLNINLHSPWEKRDEKIAEVIEDVTGLTNLSPTLPSEIPRFHAGEMDVEDEKRQEVDILPM
jgi:hypothetical protein